MERIYCANPERINDLYTYNNSKLIAIKYIASYIIHRYTYRIRKLISRRDALKFHARCSLIDSFDAHITALIV